MYTFATQRRSKNRHCSTRIPCILPFSWYQVFFQKKKKSLSGVLEFACSRSHRLRWVDASFMCLVDYTNGGSPPVPTGCNYCKLRYDYGSYTNATIRFPIPFGGLCGRMDSVCGVTGRTTSICYCSRDATMVRRQREKIRTIGYSAPHPLLEGMATRSSVDSERWEERFPTRCHTEGEEYLMFCNTIDAAVAALYGLNDEEYATLQCHRETRDTCAPDWMS